MHQGSKLGITIFAAALSMVTFTFPAGAQKDPPVKTDNSKVNKKNGNNTIAESADGQKNNKLDIKISADIRKAIVGDKTLSTYAHNIKIVTRGGMVTLKGPVRTDEEKSSVEAKAKEVAGADKVTSQVTVAPAKKGKTKKSAS